MIFAGVRLSDEVGIALEEGRLVVFAGAGISIPPPSNLPSFHGLACQICGSESVKSGKEDQALGRMKHNGTNVHQAAARILYNADTQFTELHRQTLQLFGSPDKLRIVTTNFDNHFSAAARSVFRKQSIQEYCAPALPLGDDFHGIVYLHGSARINPHAMVLTDKDFGTAYLTKGWARDFLISLFSEYTVLFIGYSHNDITIDYLARGLNRAQVKPRWTMVPSNLDSDAKEHWEHLGIGIQQYPIDQTNSNNSHQSLTDFFIGWTKHTKETLLHRSKRVKAIAAGLPPENETVSEYLNYCLQHPQLAEDFCNAVRHPAWIGWMKDKGYFEALFGDSHKDLQKYEHVIAHWLSCFVRRRHPELLLDLIRGQHQRLTRSFTQILGGVIWTEGMKSTDANFDVWVSLLLAQGEQALSQELWAYLLNNCRLPQNAGIALRLFELLTTSQIQLQEHFDFQEEGQKAKRTASKKVDYEIVWPEGSKYWLNEAWNKILRPNLALIASPLASIATKQITFSHMSLMGVGRTSDSLSWQRPSIAQHSQNHPSVHECLSLLVDIARDVFAHWYEVNPPRAAAQVEEWWSSDALLLRRLAVYGVAINPNLSADQKLKWVLDNKLIFHHGMKKEVFDILAASYPHASETMRQKLVRRIKQGYDSKTRRILGPESSVYAQFNVLVWLRRADSQCQLVADAIAEIKKTHPSFGEREHPEFDSWIGEAGFVDPKEGFDIDQILAEPPTNFVERLLSAPENSIRRDKWAHLMLLSTLFEKNRAWGQGFTDALAAHNCSSEEIWNGIFEAWKKIIKTADDWLWILSIAEGLPKTLGVLSGLANLISSVWQSEAKSADQVITEAAALIEDAWKVCSKIEESPDESYRDWLTSAINHKGGRIGEFWVFYCEYLRIQAGEKWQGMPDNLKSNIQEALRGTSLIKVYARIAMTPWMGYFYVWDKDFAVENFLPLLDWQRDSVVAQQTWSVLLHYRRATSIELEKELLPYYQQAADRMSEMLRDATDKTDQFDDHALESFGRYLAGLAMHVIPNPIKSGLFRDFLPRIPERVRTSLAQGMGDFLSAMPAEEASEIWGVWLREYIDLRLIGIPVALSCEEARFMVDWCLSLGPAFPEAVKRIEQMSPKNIFAHSIIDKLSKSSLLDIYPRESCRYLDVILKTEEYPYLDKKLTEMHTKFEQIIPGTPEIGEYEELLYLRGWQK